VSRPEPDPASLSYEQLVEELEHTIERMASGDIGIEEATELYERAGRLHALAAERLARIEERIERMGMGERGG
jgi:exodeoxyribonuclease VII small subunit